MDGNRQRVAVNGQPWASDSQQSARNPRSRRVCAPYRNKRASFRHVPLPAGKREQRPGASQLPPPNGPRPFRGVPQPPGAIDWPYAHAPRPPAWLRAGPPSLCGATLGPPLPRAVLKGGKKRKRGRNANRNERSRRRSLLHGQEIGTT